MDEARERNSAEEYVDSGYEHVGSAKEYVDSGYEHVGSTRKKGALEEE